MRATHCLLGALCALTTAVLLDAQTLVVPVSPAASTTTSGNNFPWNTGQIRFQQMYAASNFAAIKNPILINRIRFRANDASTTTTTWTGRSYTGARISMSTAATTYTAISTTFSLNHGSDLTQVFPTGTGLGTVAVAAGSGTGSGVPGVWYVDIPLSQKFLFDPTQSKDLVVEVQIDGNVTGGTSTSTAVYSGATAGAQGSRAYNTSDWQAATATGTTTEYTLATEFTYTPAQGLYASFTATPTTGGANLQVTFKDTSFTSDAGGIQSWAWDFDGDNNVDSTLQNPPAFTFKCGKYSPSLTVTDKAHPASKWVAKDLIEAGLVAAAFTVPGATRGPAPFQVSFTDQSTGPVVSYQWDFDGDNQVDSTLQSPTFTYTKDGAYDVKLTVVGPCTQDSVTKKGLIRVGETCLSTLFTGGNGLTANDSGNMFDVNVKNPNGLKITSVDISTRAAPPTSVTIDVYVTPTTWSGNENNGAVWSQVSTGTAVSQGGNAGTPTPVDIADFFLAPGKYGMYINFKNGGMHYTNGNGSNQSYSNADLDLTLGIGKGALFGGATNNPRVWNGTICYVAKDKAGSGAYGFGCLGTNSKTPRLSLSADPVIGTAVKFNITDMVNVAAGPGLFFAGLKSTQTDLTGIGMPSCALFNDALVTLGFANVSGSGSLPAVIPNKSNLIGVQLFFQTANTDAGANPLGVAASNGLAIRVGNL